MNQVETLKRIHQSRGANGFLVDLYGDSTPVPYGCEAKHPLNATLAVHMLAQTRIPVYVVSYEGQLPHKKKNFLVRYGSSRINGSLSPESWESLITCANSYNLVVAGVLDKCELELLRNWDHFTLIADAFLFQDYMKSEIEAMYQENMDLTQSYEKEVWEGRPKQDDTIKDLDITYKELEWAYTNNQRTHILDGGDPAKNDKWFKYTGRQKKVLSKVYNIERSTRYKKPYLYDQKV